MTKFAPYAPGHLANPLPDGSLQIKECTTNDTHAIAQLTAQREGGLAEEYRESIAAALTNASRTRPIYAAWVDATLVAFANLARIDVPSIPSGWYLSGLVVSPDFRRRGIGYALTEHRIRCVSEWTSTVYYFASAENRASIDLHQRFGFEEVRRGIVVPKCSFDGGVGVLYRLALNPMLSTSSS